MPTLITSLECLAPGAEVGAAVADGNALNGGAADRTAVAAEAVGNMELEVSGSLLTTGAKVGAGAGSFIINGCP